ncbi:MAG: hypothetical protein JWM78_2998 [Verrucomicrobiaceae bacterium]|nr:hypothetical protein [Verrucomicrobiaceae bacterium]
MAQGQLVVFSNAVAGREEEFNTWYSDVHVPEVLKAAPQIKSAKRFSLNTIAVQDGVKGWQFMTIYDIDAADLQPVMESMGAAMANGEFNMSDSGDLSTITMFYANPV